MTVNFCNTWRLHRVLERIVKVVFLPAAASGCLVGPDYSAPPPPVILSFSEVAQSPGISHDPVSADWWKNIDDIEFHRLVTTAITGNRSVSAAAARVRQARTGRIQAKLDLFPTVLATANYRVSRISTFGNPGIPASARDSDVLGVGVDLSWEVDLFGRLRRTLEASSALEEAAVADHEDSIRLVIAELAQNYIELRGVQARKAIALKNASSEEETLRITETMVREGQSPELDLARARSQLERTRSLVPQLEGAERSYAAQIALLTGQTLQDVRTLLQQPRGLPDYLGEVRLGSPIELLRRRPDVRSAERRLAAATAEIGVNVADLYPRVEINGTIGLEADALSHLGRSGSDAYSFLPSVKWNAFDIGRVRTRIEGAEARTDEALANFEQTVLNALAELESSIALFAKERERRDLLRRAHTDSTKAAEIAYAQYKEGLVDLLTVLDAQRVALSVEDELFRSETVVRTALVDVYRALGGGIESALPEESDPSVILHSTDVEPSWFDVLWH